MILDDILSYRRQQLTREIAAVSRQEMADRAQACSQYADHRFITALKKRPFSIVAETKKASPSKGLICPDYDPVALAKAYEKGGAAAISVLTEEHYFLGNAQHLAAVRHAVSLPILRKDFIFDPYQIDHARVLGADAVLLIVAMLAKEEMIGLMTHAAKRKLDVLMEVHDQEELQIALDVGANLIGINNRNLKTFEVDIATTQRLCKNIPAAIPVVAESGLSTNQQLKLAASFGAKAALVGECLVKCLDPSATLKKLLEGLT